MRELELPGCRKGPGAGHQEAPRSSIGALSGSRRSAAPNQRAALAGALQHRRRARRLAAPPRASCRRGAAACSTWWRAPPAERRARRARGAALVGAEPPAAGRGLVDGPSAPADGGSGSGAGRRFGRTRSRASSSSSACIAACSSIPPRRRPAPARMGRRPPRRRRAGARVGVGEQPELLGERGCHGARHLDAAEVEPAPAAAAALPAWCAALARAARGRKGCRRSPRRCCPRAPRSTWSPRSRPASSRSRRAQLETGDASRRDGRALERGRQPLRQLPRPRADREQHRRRPAGLRSRAPSSSIEAESAQWTSSSTSTSGFVAARRSSSSRTRAMRAVALVLERAVARARRTRTATAAPARARRARRPRATAGGADRARPRTRRVRPRTPRRAGPDSSSERAAREHDLPQRVGACRQLGEHARLADSGLAEDHDRGRLGAPSSPRHGALDRADLLGASDQLLGDRGHASSTGDPNPRCRTRVAN